LNEGSPLGGARPKSAVVDNDGTLAIAKFPKPEKGDKMKKGTDLFFEKGDGFIFRTLCDNLVGDSHHRRLDHAKEGKDTGAGMSTPYSPTRSQSPSGIFGR